ncbi:MAG: MBL fold metallo-hydrolase [Candidatus Izemoplasmatales bacterium]|nr:MBL fold metallo-hydrolase [Candidatus Izemoplasmatales bacterium]
MRIVVLVEDTSDNSMLPQEHGLSLYIETDRHRLLFDMGATGLFLDNATKLGIDLTQIDLAILSHGHYDHGGGLPSFIKRNPKIKIYCHKEAFSRFYSLRSDHQMHEIGIERSLMDDDRITLITTPYTIDSELELFSVKNFLYPQPEGNQFLYRQDGNQTLLDDFRHEQHLVIKDHRHMTLVVGCAHQGILNILECFKKRYREYPQIVLGGFHLTSHGLGKVESYENLSRLATALLATHSHFFTFHCTGSKAYQTLKEMMGDSINYLSTGQELKM